MFSKEKINSFKILTLTLKGMRGIEEYEIVCNGEESEVARYSKFYTRDEDERTLEKSATVPTEEIINLFNECSLIKWDGFNGPNPRGVRDGWMFTLTAEVNEGRKIRAEGSNNYPKRYHEFMAEIRKYLYGEQ